MGWCSGTEIFDTAVKAAKEAGVKSNELTMFAQKLITEMENHDWDCQCESVYFDKPGPVQTAFKNLHPSWFEDQE